MSDSLHSCVAFLGGRGDRRTSKLGFYHSGTHTSPVLTAVMLIRGQGPCYGPFLPSAVVQAAKGSTSARLAHVSCKQPG